MDIEKMSPPEQDRVIRFARDLAKNLRRIKQSTDASARENCPTDSNQKTTKKESKNERE